MLHGLRAELKQTRPFKSTHEEAFLSISRTAALLEHALAQTLRPHGLTLTQYNVLRILRGAGPDGLCRNEVGDRLVRRVPDVTRLLDRMEQSGLIARKRGDTDRRYVTTFITETGLRLLRALDDEVARAQRDQFAGIDEQDLRLVIDVLEKARSRG